MKRSMRLLFTVFVISLITNFTPTASIINAIPVTVTAAETGSTMLPNPFPLILDSKSVDYMSYVPEIVISRKIKKAISIKRPNMKLEATSAFLINSKGKVLHYKNALKPVFPGSTSKLLSSLVALDWCDMEERIKVGRELEMIAEDSSVAGLKKGEILDAATLISAMLLPSGNDAAYVMAVHVGRKSLKKPKAKCETAVKEFVRLMNEKVKALGAENSCFITPDGYDALGQYTTAYDMGLIGLEAVKSKLITKISKQQNIKASFITGEKLTWNNTNLLLNKNSEYYNPSVIGLKTGTTTMAGRCLISAAKNESGFVVSVVMNSSSKGRWSDSNKLLNYGLKHLK